MELLDDKAQFTQSTNSFNHDTVFIKDLPLLLCQIVNEPEVS